MFRTIATFAAAMMLAAPAYAQCTPADLRDGLSQEERDRIAQDVAATPHGVGRAFRAMRGEDMAVLFGTFHSSSAGGIPDAILAELEQATSVHVEITQQQNAALQQDMQSRPELILDMEGPGLKGELTAEEFDALVAATTPLGMPAEAADRLQPWFAATLVSIPTCELMVQAMGGTTLDAEIERAAVARGIPASGLETPDEALGALSGMPRDVQVDWLRMSLLPDVAPEEIFMTMAAQYGEGQIAQIMELSNVIAARTHPREEVEEMSGDMLAPLLRDRNRNWMPAILKAASDGPALVAVGALHLGGEDGLLRMLEKEGFTIERIVLEGEVK